MQPETSALFAAPELMQASSGPYDGKAADLWSCGIILYIMLFGRHPFMRDLDSELAPQQRLMAMMQRMMRSDVDFPKASLQPLSPGCIHLIKSLLVASPAHRMKIHDIRQHAWFVEVGGESQGMGHGPYSDWASSPPGMHFTLIPTYILAILLFQIPLCHCFLCRPCLKVRVR